jgi:hypothetical protein
MVLWLQLQQGFWAMRKRGRLFHLPHQGGPRIFPAQAGAILPASASPRHG